MSLDLRTTLVRDGIAAVSLEGVVPAEVYLEPKAMRCVASAAAIRAAADAGSEQMDQLLYGERFDVIDEDKGFLLGQSARDGYVGWVEAAQLSEQLVEPTHRVAALRTYAFAGPSIKSKAVALYSLNALLAVEAEEGKLSKLVDGGWVATAHLAPLGDFDDDMAGVAERYVGAPYLWGGRESLGLDCSGLVQQALFACGRACPRDADQQEALGETIGRQTFGRGDLVFWKGHVAIGLDNERIVHANGHHMATVVEPLDGAIARIRAAGSGEPTSFRRI
jgi:cell wall-associated NlpC family hydrolase